MDDKIIKNENIETPVIKACNLTKDYGAGRGIFNLNFEIKKGEMIGFVGTNGSGKTTTIRNIMGFLKPTSGAVYVNGKSTWEHSSEIVKQIGYVPGEIAFPDLSTGVEFLKSQAEFLHLKDMTYAESLIERLQLDPKANLKRMSKGMKQKTAIVAALMADPKIIILDEPTTGLDPLMRDSFIEIIKEEHKKNKTIFMSSHMFEELEKIADKVALISDGHIIDIAKISDIKNRPYKEYKIEFKTQKDYLSFLNLNFDVIRKQQQFNQVTVQIDKDKINELLIKLKKFNVKFITEQENNLEKYFKKIINKDKEKENV